MEKAYRGGADPGFSHPSVLRGDVLRATADDRGRWVNGAARRRRDASDVLRLRAWLVGCEWWPGLGTSVAQHVGEDVDDLIRRGCPRLSVYVHFFQRVDDVFGVKRDIRLAERSTVARVEGGIPLLVFVAETHHHHVGLFDQRAGADGVDARRFVIAPVAGAVRAEMIAGGVTGVMVGNGGGERHVQAARFRAALNLVTPIGVDFAG